MKPRTLFLALVLLLSFLPLRALEFRVISWEGDISGLKFRSGSDIVEISAHSEGLSRLYTVAPDTALRLWRDSVVNGETVRIPVSIPAPPADLKRGILVLAAGSDINTFGGSWLDDSLDQAPPGTVRFFNYTRHPLALKTSGDQWLQSPGEARRVSFDASRRAMPIQVAAENDGRWSRVANVSQPVRPAHRLLVFLRDARPSLGGPRELIELRVVYDL